MDGLRRHSSSAIDSTTASLAVGERREVVDETFRRLGTFRKSLPEVAAKCIGRPDKNSWPIVVSTNPKLFGLPLLLWLLLLSLCRKLASGIIIIAMELSPRIW